MKTLMDFVAFRERSKGCNSLKKLHFCNGYGCMFICIGNENINKFKIKHHKFRKFFSVFFCANSYIFSKPLIWFNTNPFHRNKKVFWLFPSIFRSPFSKVNYDLLLKQLWLNDFLLLWNLKVDQLLTKCWCCCALFIFVAISYTQ